MDKVVVVVGGEKPRLEGEITEDGARHKLKENHAGNDLPSLESLLKQK